MANLTNGAGTTFFGIRKTSGSLGALHIGDSSGTQYEILTGSTGGATLKNITTIDASGLASLDGGIDVNDSAFVVSTAGAVSAARLDNNDGGITNAGAVSGVTTLDASGLASLDGGINVDDNFTVSTGGAVVAASLNNSSGGITNAGSIAGATTIGSTGAATLDSSGAGSSFGGDLSVGADLTVTGNFTVNGTTTTVNSTTITVDDKNIELGSTDTPTDTSADGGGITLKGTTDHTIVWTNSTDSWDFSEHVNAASGKEFRIAGTSVLNATTLGGAVVNSSLTSVGVLDGGSITSGFGNIDIGTSTLNAGSSTFTVLTASTSATFTELASDSADLTVPDGKTLDGDGAFDFSAGSLTLADNQISGDKVEGGTIASITISQLAGAMDANDQAMTNVNIDSGAIDGTTIGANSAAAATVTSLTLDEVSLTAVVTEDEGIGNNDNDTSFPTSAAVKDYVDSQVGGSSLEFTDEDDTAGLSIDLDSETLSFDGTANQISTSGAGNVLTISLTDDVSLVGDLTVGGGDIDITGDGTGAGRLSLDSTTVLTLSGSDVTAANDLTVSNNLTVSNESTFDAAATFGDTVSVDGDATFSANMDLGQNSGHTITLNGVLASGATDATIGQDGSPFSFVYATNVITGDLHMKNERGDWTLFEESDHIRIRNNATGQTFKMDMTLVQE